MQRRVVAVQLAATYSTRAALTKTACFTCERGFLLLATDPEPELGEEVLQSCVHYLAHQRRLVCLHSPLKDLIFTTVTSSTL